MKEESKTDAENQWQEEQQATLLVRPDSKVNGRTKNDSVDPSAPLDTPVADSLPAHLE